MQSDMWISLEGLRLAAERVGGSDVVEPLRAASRALRCQPSAGGVSAEAASALADAVRAWHAALLFTADDMDDAAGELRRAALGLRAGDDRQAAVLAAGARTGALAGTAPTGGGR